MTITSSTTFSTLLKRHRLAAGLTQEGLAERAGISARGVQDLERGVRTSPRAETVRLLTEALGLGASARSELIAAARPETATSLASMPIHRTLPSLPVPATPLIGREREIAEACARLDPDRGTQTTRLLTLTGPGGVGKTRLALAVVAELAAAFGQNVAWVDLAPLRDPELVAPAIARVLGVQEAGDRPLTDLLTAALANHRLLLVLDNVEHLLPAAALVSTLLAAAPDLVILATSRSRLRLRGEREFPVAPLPVPEAEGKRSAPLASLAGVPAVRLFVARAQDVEPGFAFTAETALPVVQICRRLDGLPLALELAAVRIKILPAGALAAKLEQRLPLLSSGPRDAPERQRTMRDAIAWSHDLLSPREQSLFRRLAVFRGGLTLAAAEAIVSAQRLPGTGDDDVLTLLSSLADQHLLQLSHLHAEGGAAEPRFSFLETVREFALECLEGSGEAETLRAAHATIVGDLVAEVLARIHGPEGPAVLQRLEAEHDNLRAALAWAIETKDVSLALRLTHGAWRFWWMRSYLDEGRAWLERALAVPDAGRVGDALRPRVVVAAGYFARVQGDYPAAVAAGERALALARLIDDASGASAALHLLGLAAFDQGAYDEARAHHSASLEIDREQGYSHGIAYQLSSLGDVALAQRQCAEAEAFGTEALAIWRSRGDAWGIALSLIQLGRAARARDDTARAVSLLRQSLQANAQLGDKEISARATSELAAIAGDRGQSGEATYLYGMAAALRNAIGAPAAPADRVAHEQAVAEIRARLDDAAFEAAWNAGHNCPLDQANAEALRLVDVLT